MKKRNSWIAVLAALGAIGASLGYGISAAKAADQAAPAAQGCGCGCCGGQ